MRKIFPVTIALVTIVGLAGCAPAESVSTETESAAVATTGPSTAVEETSATNTETETGEAGTETSEPVQATEQPVANPTSEEIVLAALMGPDGEYAAAASYLAVLEEYGDVEPYATIYEAELRHANALIRQLERLGAEVPVNPYEGNIEAPADLETAALAWAEGEILNIELYDYLLTQTDDSQLTRVLNNLRSASLDSHLPAFEEAAANGGTLDDFTGGHS